MHPEIVARPAPRTTFRVSAGNQSRWQAAGVKVGIENGRIAALDLKWVLDTLGSPTFGIVWT
jgi:hypothetical protein